VNNAYIEAGDMSWDVIEGWWTDAGTFDSLLKASNLVAESQARNRGKQAAESSKARS
jgi:glucose-1-phosphate thymidylyltransferase